MSIIIYSPSWFFGVDVILQFITVFVALVLSIAAFKLSRFFKGRHFFHFSLSFLLISVSYIIKILTDLFIYNRFNEERSFINILSEQFSTIEIVSIFGNLAHRFILLLGFLILIMMLLKIRDKRVIFLLTYFIFIVSAFSIWSFLLFQTTLAVFAGTAAVHYIFEYIERKRRIMLNSMIGFSILFMAQISFMFTFFFERRMFVLGHMLQASAFMMLLITYILVQKR